MGVLEDGPLIQPVEPGESRHRGVARLRARVQGLVVQSARVTGCEEWANEAMR